MWGEFAQAFLSMVRKWDSSAAKGAAPEWQVAKVEFLAMHFGRISRKSKSRFLATLGMINEKSRKTDLSLPAK